MIKNTTIIIKCSNGHRFPVNLEKHQNRNYRWCPKCGEQITIKKKHFWQPNPNWQQEKIDRADVIRETKAKKKKSEPLMQFPIDARLAAANILAKAVAEQQKKEGKAKNEN